MNPERLRSFVRKGTLATLPVAAVLYGCGDEPSKTVTIDIPQTNKPLVDAIRANNQEQQIIEEARKNGQGVVFIYMEKPKADAEIKIRLDRMDGPSLVNRHLDKQSGTIAPREVPENATAIRWFQTATCGGEYRLAFSLDGGTTYRGFSVSDENGIQQPTFQLIDCSRNISITLAINTALSTGN